MFHSENTADCSSGAGCTITPFLKAAAAEISDLDWTWLPGDFFKGGKLQLLFWSIFIFHIFSGFLDICLLPTNL